MDRESVSDVSTARVLSKPQRRSVIRAGGIAIVLCLAIPFYYGFLHLYPALGTVVPAIIAHTATGVGLFVAFPGAVAYARILEHRSLDGDATQHTKYGVNDRWERRNL